MKCQIQVRGAWGGTAGDWRPALSSTDGAGGCTFASWDEAEDVLDRMQRAGLLPADPDEVGAELRIIDIEDRRSFAHARSANDPRGQPRWA
jgi:hypothetical protein